MTRNFALPHIVFGARFLAEFTLSTQSEILRFAQDDSEGPGMTRQARLSVACPGQGFESSWSEVGGESRRSCLGVLSLLRGALFFLVHERVGARHDLFEGFAGLPLRQADGGAHVDF